ncbi:MAG: hypothetical protein KDA24_12245 [Deltaproteobacteria bacterium]|nr:hypothetical protein [Deltaproteobacteria bacterium]
MRHPLLDGKLKLALEDATNSYMFDVPVLQPLIYPVAVLYLMLHAGPLFRVRYEPSIRGGTAWTFFGSEVLLFTSYLLFAPAIVDNWVGRIALGLHLSMHVVFTVMDYFAHDFMLGTALTRRESSAVWWAAKEGGLVLDTITHAIAVTLLALALPPALAVGLLPLSLLAFVFVSNGYVRRHGGAATP